MGDTIVVETCDSTSETNKSAAPHHTGMCHVCGKLLKYAASLRTHERIHSPKKRRKSPGDEKAILALCQFCGKTFDHMGDFKKHERTHTGNRPYVCEFVSCGMGFATGSNLARHNSAHYGTMKRFPCIFCECEYTRKWAVTEHMKKKHFRLNP